jgi:hypothetical protein
MIFKGYIAKKNIVSKTLIAVLVFLFPHFMSFGQEKTVISPDLQLQYLKNSDEQSSLKATLTYSKNRMAIPVGGIEVTFYTGNGNRTKLADIKTNDKGEASMILEGTGKLHKNENYAWNFSAVSGGNDTLAAGESSVSVRDLKLQMKTEIIDTVKTISLKAEKEERNSLVPAGGVLVTVYVPRMFSLLPVGEVTLDATGSGTLEFPPDIPGDKDGNITIIAKVEDDPDFGNLEKVETLKWGTISAPQSHAGHRALWTKTPPMWMIITLTILLSGVWGHYLYTLICLIRIKRESRKYREDKKVDLFIKNA